MGYTNKARKIHKKNEWIYIHIYALEMFLHFTFPSFSPPNHTIKEKNYYIFSVKQNWIRAA